MMMMWMHFCLANRSYVLMLHRQVVAHLVSVCLETQIGAIFIRYFSLLIFFFFLIIFFSISISICWKGRSFDGGQTVKIFNKKIRQWFLFLFSSNAYLDWNRCTIGSFDISGLFFFHCFDSFCSLFVSFFSWKYRFDLVVELRFKTSHRTIASKKKITLFKLKRYLSLTKLTLDRLLL